MTNNNVTSKKESRSIFYAVIVFPIIILIASAIGLFFPEATMPLNGMVVYLLGIVMFTMGLTIKKPDLKIVIENPHAIIRGFFAQYLIMPITALSIGVLLQLDPILIVGLVLLGSTPGGASSNIVAYLAKGNVALSISMTTLSTLLAPLVTPLLVLGLAGSFLPVSFWAMFVQIIQMVIFPVALGLLVRAMAKKWVEKISPSIPWISVTVLSLVIIGIMAGSAEVFFDSALIILLAVILHNAIGFLLGYLAARIGRLGRRERRAVAVEVGMQNAGLAAALANSHFSPIAAIPAAIATIWHNVGGAIFSLIFVLTDQIRERRQNSEEPVPKLEKSILKDM